MSCTGRYRHISRFSQGKGKVPTLHAWGSRSGETNMSSLALSAVANMSMWGQSHRCHSLGGSELVERVSTWVFRT